MVCKGFRKCHSERLKIKDCKKCIVVTEESNPTVKEKGISYTIGNKHRQELLRYEVDGSLISGVLESRCDYLMMFPACMKAFFIELKSQDWKKAVSQLNNSVRLLYPDMNDYIPHLRAVVRRDSPNTKYNQLAKMRRKLMYRYPGATLEVKSRFNDEV